MYKILANTLFIGKNLIYVPECHSTSSLLMELTQKTKAPEGTLVITDCQTKGRGQRGNAWEAEAGLNLTFSFLLKPTFLQAAEQFNITKAVSVALCDFLTPIAGGSVRIKWPNDMMIGDKKVTGILIENSLTGYTIQQSVVGIGVNVNQETFQHSKAVSLKIAIEKSFELNQVLNEILQHIERRYLQLKSNKPAIHEDYMKHLYRCGETKRYKVGGTEVDGTIEGVDSIGKLLVKIDNELRSFAMKEIQFL